MTLLIRSWDLFVCYGKRFPLQKFLDSRETLRLHDVFLEIIHFRKFPFLVSRNMFEKVSDMFRYKEKVDYVVSIN